jgi:hypothetical protein
MAVEKSEISTPAAHDTVVAHSTHVMEVSMTEDIVGGEFNRESTVAFAMELRRAAAALQDSIDSARGEGGGLFPKKNPLPDENQRTHHDAKRQTRAP